MLEPPDDAAAATGASTVAVSVIIAARNAEAYLETAVRSALAQTLAGIEVIIVDDGSFDGTRSIADRLHAGDARVQIIGQAMSRGVSAARNAALDRARGTWIAILDADDEMDPVRLDRLVAAATRRRLDMVGDNQMLRDFDTQDYLGAAFPDRWMEDEALLTPEQMLERDLPVVTGQKFGIVKPLMRRAFLEANGLRYDPDISVAEDFLLYVHALLRGARFGTIPDALYVYKIRPGSTSRRRGSDQQVLQVNRLLLEATRRSAPALAGRLRSRGHMLALEALIASVRVRDWRQAGRDLPGVRPRDMLVEWGLPAIRRRLRRGIARLRGEF